MIVLGFWRRNSTYLNISIHYEKIPQYNIVGSFVILMMKSILIILIHLSLHFYFFINRRAISACSLIIISTDSHLNLLTF